MPRSLTTQEFVEKAVVIHSDRYDYSSVDYVGSQVKVTIGCPEHGLFEQIPNDHLCGSGCPHCAGNVTLSIQEFIERANAVHGDRYDYLRVNYTSSHKKVNIVCTDHGLFEQSPHEHLRGQGCPWCGGKVKLSTEEFIEKAKVVHGDLYDYLWVNYKDIKTKVVIVCPDHGPFEQTPSDHTQGCGCPRCGGTIKSSTQEFIEKAKAVHSSVYDYSLVDYINTATKIIIGCSSHGPFEQIPNDHLCGSGCPRCTTQVSKPSQLWLASLGVPDGPDHREVRRLIPGKRYTVDGYDPTTKTVYEFHGDYWHGNPARYDPDGINTVSKKTFGQLYQSTLQKQQDFLNAGYQYVEIWESEWKRQQQIVLDE
jgi:hypothetical protein